MAAQAAGYVRARAQNDRARQGVAEKLSGIASGGQDLHNMTVGIVEINCAPVA
jgi:hypothetical protein